MRASRIRVLCFAVFSVICVSNAAWAGDVHVVHAIDDLRRGDRAVEGSLTVQVFNASDGDLFNVDLRLETGGANTVTRPVVQLGSIGAREAATAASEFTFEPRLLDDGGALVWRLDYDDGRGNHSSMLVVSERAD